MTYSWKNSGVRHVFVFRTQPNPNSPRNATTTSAMRFDSMQLTTCKLLPVTQFVASFSSNKWNMNFGAFKNGAKVPPVVPVGATVQVVLISEAMSNRMTAVISDGETEWKGNDHSTILLSFTNTFCNSKTCCGLFYALTKRNNFGIRQHCYCLTIKLHYIL